MKDEDVKRSTSKVDVAAAMANKAAANKAVAAVAGGSAELTELAQTSHVTENFSEAGNNYKIDYYIYSFHSFNDADGVEYDWFLRASRGNV